MKRDLEIDLSEIKDFMKVLATQSAEIIKPYFSSSLEIKEKSDQSPVTLADTGSEQKIRELITDKFPSHGILGEELGTINPEARYQWVIDPIDGTKSFSTGSFDFGTCVAFLKDGKPIVGMIHHPILDETLIGDGKTTERNNKEIKLVDIKSVDQCVLLLTDLFNVGNFQNSIGYTILTRQVKYVRTWGNCYGYTLLAKGYPVIMVDPVMALWDIMALIPIIEGAGGIITDYQGNDPSKGHSIVACSKNIHHEIIRLLNHQFVPEKISLLTELNSISFKEWQKSVKEFVVSYKQEISLNARILDLQSELSEMHNETNKLFNGLALPTKELEELTVKISDEIGDTLFSFICLVNDLSIIIDNLVDFFRNYETDKNLYIKNKLLDDAKLLNGLTEAQRKIGQFESNLYTEFSIKNKTFLLPQTHMSGLISAMGALAKWVLKITDYGKKTESIGANADVKHILSNFLFHLITLSSKLNINLDVCLDNVLLKYQNRFIAHKTFGSTEISRSIRHQGVQEMSAFSEIKKMFLTYSPIIGLSLAVGIMGFLGTKDSKKTAASVICTASFFQYIFSYKRKERQKKLAEPKKYVSRF